MYRRKIVSSFVTRTSPICSNNLLIDELDKERLLSVQSILGLIEYDALGSIDDIGSLLLSSHGG